MDKTQRNPLRGFFVIHIPHKTILYTKVVALYEDRKTKLLRAVNYFTMTDNLIVLAYAKDILDSILRSEKLKKKDLRKLSSAIISVDENFLNIHKKIK